MLRFVAAALNSRRRCRRNVEDGTNLDRVASAERGAARSGNRARLLAPLLDVLGALLRVLPTPAPAQRLAAPLVEQLEQRQVSDESARTNGAHDASLNDAASAQRPHSTRCCSTLARCTLRRPGARTQLDAASL